MKKKKLPNYALGGQYTADASMFGKENMFAQGNPAAAGMAMATGFLPADQTMNDYAFTKNLTQMGAMVGGPAGAAIGAAIGLPGDYIKGREDKISGDKAYTKRMEAYTASLPDPYEVEGGYKQTDPRGLAEGGKTPPYRAKNKADYDHRVQMYNDSMNVHVGLDKMGDLLKLNPGKWLYLNRTDYKNDSQYRTAIYGKQFDQSMNRLIASGSDPENPKWSAGQVSHKAGDGGVNYDLTQNLFVPPKQKVLPPLSTPRIKRTSIDRMETRSTGSNSERSPLPATSNVAMMGFKPVKPSVVTPGFMDERVANFSTIKGGANRQMAEFKVDFADGGNPGSGHVIPAENVGVAIQDAVRAGRSDVIRSAKQNESIGGIIPGNGHPKADDKVMKPGGGTPIKISSGEMYVNDDVFSQMAASRGVDPVSYGQMMYPNGIRGNAFADGGPVDPPKSNQNTEYNLIGRSGGSRSWRNNNPGNIMYNEYSKKLGAIGSDGRFAIFPDLESGTKAQERLLFEGANYRDLTMDQAISRWAPSHENNTTSYIKKMGGDPSRKMNEYTPEERLQFLQKMREIEGWKEGIVQEMKDEDSVPESSAEFPTIGTQGLVEDIQIPEVPIIPSTSSGSGSSSVGQQINQPDPIQLQPVSQAMDQNINNPVAIAMFKNGGMIPKYAGGGPTGPVVGNVPRPYPWMPSYIQDAAYGKNAVSQFPEFTVNRDAQHDIDLGNKSSQFMWPEGTPIEGNQQSQPVQQSSMMPDFAPERMDQSPGAINALSQPLAPASLAGVQSQSSATPKSAVPGSLDEPMYDFDKQRQNNANMMWGQLPLHVVSAMYNIGTDRDRSPAPLMLNSQKLDYNTDSYASELDMNRQNTNSNYRYNVRGKSGVGKSVGAAEIDSANRRRNSADVQRIKNQESAGNVQIGNLDHARNTGAMNEWNRYESAATDRHRAMKGQALSQNLSSAAGIVGTKYQNDIYLNMAENRNKWNQWAYEQVKNHPSRFMDVYMRAMNGGV